MTAFIHVIKKTKRLKTFSCLIMVLASISVDHVAQAISISEVGLNPSSDEHIVWQRAPIAITLPVGKERFVSFPNEVQFGYNTQLLPSTMLRVENDHRTLYLLAKQPFEGMRTEAKLSNGEIILLDINAKQEADDNPVDIVLPAIPSTHPDKGQSDLSTDQVTYVTLMRYAIQQLYAPEYLLKQSTDMTRFPMETAHAVPMFLDGSASAMPLTSWRGGDLYVTAVFVKNVLHQPLILDPKVLCGAWKATSFYPQTILSFHGAELNQDATTAFLISDRPFSQAIVSCLN